jgi:menaquinone-dependent protoporphyrinogen oxidase
VYRPDDVPQDRASRPKEMAGFRKAIRPRDERIFFGALDYHKLSFPERMVMKAMRAPEGDFRDWPAIEAWAASIDRDLG